MSNEERVAFTPPPKCRGFSATNIMKQRKTKTDDERFQSRSW